MVCLRSAAMVIASSGYLSACVVVPPPANDVALQSSLDEPVESHANVALNVVSAANPKAPNENEAPLAPEEAAQQIQSGLYSKLAGFGLFNSAVGPDGLADYDMTVTITEFDDETLIPGKTQALGGDGLNQMTAEVVLTKRDSDTPPFQYVVEASAPSESYYNPSYGHTGVQPMLDQAIEGIVDGLQQGIDGEAFSDHMNFAEAE